MNKRITRPLSVLTASILAVCFMTVLAYKSPAFGAGSETQGLITVCVSVEKFTLGQGYIIEPTLVKISDKTKVSDLITTMLQQRYPEYSQPWEMTGSTDADFYLSAVYDPDRGTPKIPAYIANRAVIDPDDATGDWLGEFDYSPESGWMYSIDGKFPGVGASERLLSDGEVVRWQFTIVGYGSDLGADNIAWGAEDIVNVGKKEALTEAVAVCNAKFDKAMLNANANYGNALKALTDPEASQESVDAALRALLDDGPRFRDVAKNAWYTSAVDYVLEEKLFNGVSSVEFSPGGNLTRAMAITVLYRMAGSPTTPAVGLPFPDIDLRAWYGAAVTWAASERLADGILVDGNLKPDNVITREELAELLYRSTGPNGAGGADLSAFSDGATVSAPFKEAVAWAVAEGILQGTDAGALLPRDNLTRAQFAAMLLRYAQGGA